MSGYAVIEAVEEGHMKVAEKSRLPSNWSAESCEIYVLKRGLDMLEGERGTREQSVPIHSMPLGLFIIWKNLGRKRTFEFKRKRPIAQELNQISVRIPT